MAVHKPFRSQGLIHILQRSIEDCAFVLLAFFAGNDGVSICDKIGTKKEIDNLPKLGA
ncbi:hypothetical protein [uncultured Rhodoblastus sp.]|uniref:hypothetical protein n=1 Tax=uncultured Rhodoblastus sp. TaxID=543037 RepID=UPI0025D3D9AC|nr:hypothetical protein [uncultured Rhodoblastus sp.]